MNANVNTKKPTAMRMAMKPMDATMIVGRWVSAYSTSSGTTVERSFGRSRMIVAAAARKNTAPTASTHGAPNQRNTSAPIPAPIPPSTALTRARRA